MCTAVTGKRTVEFVFYTVNSVENVFHTVGGCFPHCWRVFHTVHSSNLQFGNRIHLIIGQKVLKIKKSNLFLFLPVTLRKTIEKTKFTKILSFHVEKWGSQAGVHPISTFGLDGYPCFWPPFSNWKTQNYRSFGFSNCFPQLLLEKRETKYYFLLINRWKNRENKQTTYVFPNHFIFLNFGSFKRIDQFLHYISLFLNHTL